MTSKYGKHMATAVSAVMLLLLSSCIGGRPGKPIFVVVRAYEDILPISSYDSVPAILYDNEMDFSELPVDVKKQGFIDMVLPSILAVKYNYEIDFLHADRIMRELHERGYVSGIDSSFMDQQQERFNARNWWDARKRLITHPTSIVIAQAAVESGWGSSRFFREANNLFGIWSYDPDEQRIRSLTDRASGGIYLRAYSNVAASIQDYFEVIARASAYRRFRRERARSSDPHRLIHLLTNYSELRGRYIKKLEDVIDQNDLTRYDKARLDPSFIPDSGYIPL
ncbi:glucosaminidase domain-containing protein [Fulvivirga sedimenti]|uniref:Glucosaminidase domain-containing protein n=1 Tax=Fulvivirga sedimenti TaxID=2879465 RepID=A0A9X1L1I4_9BACT|nr:glucosaminidase domain-containing protein [Fulvivirga sedimenti]MCA6078874.1 glucosaminidase domain-containing protein [Fulvivirga sedimenti]